MSDYSVIKNLLQLKLKELAERATGLEDILSDPGDADSEENALAMENDEALLAIGRVTVKEVQDIKLAIERIENGKYGTCIACGKKISKERLTAIPWTSTCVNCA